MWKVIPDTNENYSANDETSQIKSNDRLGPDGRKLKGKILRPFIQNSGYCVVDLRINNHTEKHLVHRLMAKTFLDDYCEDLDINHIDCNKQNNRLYNLECITRKENLKHAREHGLIKMSESQREQRDKIKDISRELNSKPIDMLSLKGVFEEHFDAASDAKRKYGFDISAIGRVANGRQLTSYGHLWKWADKETA